MGLWDIILIIIKFIISYFTENNLFKIYYIIQIVFSSIPSIIVALFIICGIFRSSNFFEILCCDWDCYFFALHKFLFCLIAFFLCFGGFWIKMDDLCDLEYECCCNSYNCADNECGCYILYGTLYCDCCCCSTSCDCCECCDCCEDCCNC